MSKKMEPFFHEGERIKDPIVKTYYKIHTLLGSGAFAQCYLVSAQSSEEMFAMKIINHTKIESKNLLAKLESEIHIHSSLNHPNIVKMYTYFRDTKYLYLLLEYCPNKGLDALVKKTPMKEEEVRKLMSQLADALTYLHEEKNVIHRDLKLGNLFLDKDFNLKIGDFGLSAVILGNQKKRTVCGTPNYIAPEILFDNEIGHSYEVDIWAYGVVLYTLLVGIPPFQKKNLKEIYQNIKKIDYSFPEDYPHSRYSKDLIRKILNRNPEKRPTLNDIKNHNFFKRKENTIERIIRNISENTYEQKSLTCDYVTFSLPISRFKGIGYVLSSGYSGIYFYDHTNIVTKKNKTVMYLYKTNEKNSQIIKKEEYAVENIPKGIIEKYQNLSYFILNFCKNRSSNEIENTQVLRIKRVEDGILFGLYNGNIQFDFNDERRVVIAEDGKLIFCFNNTHQIDFCSELRKKCLGILKLVK